MQDRERGKWSSWVATTSICFLTGLLAITLFIKLHYGSLATVAHAWRGDLVLFDRYEVAIDHPQPVQMVAFRMTNTSSQPIRILGAQSSCTCVMATGLPLNFAPGTTKTLEVRFKPKTMDGPIRESVRVFTDRPGQQIIPLTISTDPTRVAKGTNG